MSELTLRKKGFLFKWAYAWSNKENKVVQVSLCRLIWRLLFSFLPWAGISVFYVFGFIICSFLTILLLCLFGCRPTILKNDNIKKPFVLIKCWPKINGYRVYPFYVLIPVAVFWPLSQSNFFPAVSEITHSTFNWLVPILPVILAWVIIICLLGLAVWVLLSLVPKIFKESYNSEIVTLARAYIKAKKDKVCPIIRVVEEA